MGGGGGHIHLPVFPLRCPDRRGKNQGGGGEKYRAPPPPPRLLLWEVGKSLPLSTTAETDFFLRFSTVPSPPFPLFSSGKRSGKSFFLPEREGKKRGEKKGIELLHSQEGKKEDWLAAAAKPAEDSPMLWSPVKNSRLSHTGALEDFQTERCRIRSCTSRQAPSASAINHGPNLW